MVHQVEGEKMSAASDGDGVGKARGLDVRIVVTHVAVQRDFAAGHEEGAGPGKLDGAEAGGIVDDGGTVGSDVCDGMAKKPARPGGTIDNSPPFLVINYLC